MTVCLFGAQPLFFLSAHDALGASLCHDKTDYVLLMCVTAAEAAQVNRLCLLRVMPPRTEQEVLCLVEV